MSLGFFGELHKRSDSSFPILKQLFFEVVAILIMEKEAKKEAFRKYLESGGVIDALTKVLVALYEEQDKPSSALEFVQEKLGGPSLSDYEKLQAEKADLQLKYDELFAAHEETCRLLEELKNTKTVATCKEVTTEDNLKDY